MGEIADKMINGGFCHYCGVYLEPNERVYLVHFEKGTKVKTNMPANGEPYGVPVQCKDCFIES